MMRRLILIFFVFIVCGVILALVFRDHSGYVLVSFAGWQLETSLLFAAAVVVVGIWLLLSLWRLIVAGALLPRSTRRWRARRRARKARRSMYAGLLKYAEGRWARAESEIQKRAEQHEEPAVNYLYAAQAAQRQGHSADRDNYLAKAAESKGASELAVLLTQAQLQIEQGQDAQAQASLARLHELSPQHPYVLELYGEQCVRSGDFAKLHELVPTLYKHSSASRQRIDTWVALAWDDTFKRAGKEIDALIAAWKKVPRQQRHMPAVLHSYLGYLHAAGGDEQAAKLIRTRLKHDWDARLVLLFGKLDTGAANAQLSSVEDWIKQYGEEPELLLVAGRLCLRSQLWGRARNYFEASLKKQAQPQALLALGQLYEQDEQPDEARDAYRRGLELQFPEHKPG